MNSPWRLRTICFLLLALMLTAQAANASHELQHQSLDHTELCQAFVTADSAPAIEFTHAQIPAFAIGGQAFFSYSAADFQCFYSSLKARAPPHH